MTARTTKWQKEVRNRLVNVGKDIVGIESDLVDHGFSAFVPVQDRYLALANSSEDVEQFSVYKSERAAEILSSSRYFGSHRNPGDGYISSYLQGVRRFDDSETPQSLASRMELALKTNRQKTLQDASIAFDRAAERVEVESCRYPVMPDLRFDGFENIISVIRNTAELNGAKMSNGFPPAADKIMFAQHVASDISVGWSLLEPNKVYSDYILLTWKTWFLNLKAEDAIGFKINASSELAQPVEIDFSIMGFNIYNKCVSLAAVANNLNAYMIAACLVAAKTFDRGGPEDGSCSR